MPQKMSPGEVIILRDKLQEFYQTYNPKKLTEIDKVLEMYAGKGEQLFLNLAKKYNVHPSIFGIATQAAPHSDEELAKRIGREEKEKMKNNIAKANPLREQKLMAQTTDGKAVLAVQKVFELVDNTRKHAKKGKEPYLANCIAAVTREDMFHFAKAMLELQQDFFLKNVNGYIDVGYHYTGKKNLSNIRHHGLLTRKDRDSYKVQSASHGSVFGDGIYTANNPHNFSKYGDTGLLVARLTGEMVRVARSLHPSITVDTNTNTIIGDKMNHATGLQSLDKDKWPMSDAYHEIVLRSSAQCLPVISFDSRTRQSNEGIKYIKMMEKGLQEIFDTLFNRGMKRSAYQDAEILKAPSSSSSYQLPVINQNPHLQNLLLTTTTTMPRQAASGPNNRSSLKHSRQKMRGKTVSSSTNHSSQSNTLTYTAPTALTTGIPSDAMSTPDSSCKMDEDCVICQDPLGKRQTCAMLKCQHVFHKDCIQRAFQSKPQCPVCRKSIGAPIGKSPSGTMASISSSFRCAGYSEGSIVIRYSIPAGRQMSYHDAPGTSHGSKHVTAYVPK